MRTNRERVKRILEKAETKRMIRRKRIRAVTAVSAALVFLLILNLTLFLPYTIGGNDLSAYQKSEYYPLIEKIDSLSFDRHTTNNFTEWGLGGKTTQTEDSAKDPSPGGSDASLDGYREVTNNQVQGVIEGDLFKRSDHYLFYLSATSSDWMNSGKVTERLFLSAYSIAGYDSKLIGKLAIDPEPNTDFSIYNGKQEEMYLSSDAKTITIVSPCQYEEDFLQLQYTVVIRIDVSDPTAPKEISRNYVSGGLVSSRLFDEKLLLITDFTLRRPDFSNPKEYLPQTGKLDNLQTFPMQKIILPDQIFQTRYTVLTCFDESGTLTDEAAYFSCADEVFVSKSRVYTVNTFLQLSDDETSRITMSTIYCMSYSDGFRLLGSFSVEGRVRNQFSLDEKDDILRLFTTSTISAVANGKNNVEYGPSPAPKEECNLYCVDLDNFTIIASITNFAPEGESIQSVRFDGNIAYVCTADVFDVTDPVFEFDLSDYKNIKYTHSGTIPGFSLTLINFYDNTLLGIGCGEFTTDLKIMIYKTSGEDIFSAANYEMKEVNFFTDIKDYFIDAENGLVGLAIYRDASGSGSYYDAYLLLRFDGTEITEVLREEGFYHNSRACLVDGFFYILDGYNFTVEKIF